MRMCLRLLIVLSLVGLPAMARGQDTTTTTPATREAFPNRPRWTGVGINIGNLVTGVTAKFWASSTVAVQAAAGGGSGGNDLRAHADLTFSPAQWASRDGQYLLPLYAGLGGVAGHRFTSGPVPSSTEAGFRVPVGMSVLVRGNPVELFLEVAPEVAIRNNPSPSGRYTVSADGAIGLRYYL